MKHENIVIQHYCTRVKNMVMFHFRYLIPKLFLLMFSNTTVHVISTSSNSFLKIILVEFLTNKYSVTFINGLPFYFLSWTYSTLSAIFFWPCFCTASMYNYFSIQDCVVLSVECFLIAGCSLDLKYSSSPGAVCLSPGLPVPLASFGMHH